MRKTKHTHTHPADKMKYLSSNRISFTVNNINNNKNSLFYACAQLKMLKTLKSFFKNKYKHQPNLKTIKTEFLSWNWPKTDIKLFNHTKHFQWFENKNILDKLKDHWNFIFVRVESHLWPATLICVCVCVCSVSWMNLFVCKNRK